VYDTKVKERTEHESVDQGTVNAEPRRANTSESEARGAADATQRAAFKSALIWLAGLFTLPILPRAAAGRLVSPARMVTAPARLFVNWLARFEEQASYQSESTAPTELEALLECFKETTKEARNIFVLHLSITAYSLLTLGGVRDEDFYGSRGTVQLPVISVQVPAAVFFLVAPLLSAAVATYLHVYLGYARRFYRILVQRSSSDGELNRRNGVARDALQDQLYPWIATLSDSRGPFGTMVRTLFTILTNWAAPLVAICYWLRVLRFDAHMADLWQRQLPPMVLMGALAFAVTALFTLWSSTRRTLDARLGLTEAISTSGWLSRIVSVGIAGIVCLPAAQTHGLLCDRWPGRDRAAFLCKVDLEQAVLSRPLKDGVPVLGALLQGARLRYANLRGAYLDDAHLNNVDLTGADLTAAHLEHAVLVHARLEGANFAVAKLQSASFVGADLRRANFLGAQLQGTFFAQAQLSAATFAEAELQGAFFGGATLYGAVFSLAELQGANLFDAPLEGAKFDHAQLQGVHFQSAQLEGASFEESALQGADFAGAQLQGADFSGASYDKGPLVMEEMAPDRWPTRVKQQLDHREEPVQMNLAIAGPPLIDGAAFCADLGFPLGGGKPLGHQVCERLRCRALRDAAKTNAVLRAVVERPAEHVVPCPP